MTSQGSFEVSTPPSFDEVADELYGYPPRMFAALRAERAEQARTAGAADTATRIERLRVPSAAAWLSNQLVRHFRDQVLLLLELGRALQVATETLNTGTENTGTETTGTETTGTETTGTGTGNTRTAAADALWCLDTRRRDVCNELHRRAAWLAVEDRVTAGRPVLRGLGDSLHSAMCNESMAREMLAGRLVRSLPRISWPGLTPDHFPDELARRRALRVARGVERPGRYATDEDDERDEHDEHDEDDENAPLATVSTLPTRTR